MNQNIVEVEHLHKSYGTHVAVKDISFKVKEGEVFALLGGNGAGKTSTLECLEGQRKFDSGQIAVKGKMGIQLQSSSLPGYMTAEEALRLFAKWKRGQVQRDYLERIGVTPFMKRQYRQLSTGQKRRLHLALAMLGDPDVIFLDEPTAGLDVEGRASLHGEISCLKENGKTVIMASHDMAEVEKLCDRIVILKSGVIVYEGTPGDLGVSGSEIYHLKVKFSDVLRHKGFHHLSFIKADQGYDLYQTEKLTQSLAEIAQAALAEQVLITDIRVDQESLEQRVLEMF